jgi:hypothetical protein
MANCLHVSLAFFERVDSVDNIVFLYRQVEARLRQLEGRALGKISGAAKGKAKIESYDKDRKKDTPGVLSAAKVNCTGTPGCKTEKRMEDGLAIFCNFMDSRTWLLHQKSYLGH